MEASSKDFLKLHFIVFLWGFTAILGNEMTIPSTDVVMYRTALASVVLAGFMYFKSKTFQVNRAELTPLILVGFIIAAHWFLFFESARVSNVSVSLAGMATTTFWTSLIEPLFNKRKIRLFEVVLGLVVISGLYVIFRFEFNNALGLGLAMASAFMAALFSVLNGKMTHRLSQYTITFYEMASAAIGIAIFIPFYKHFFLGETTIYALPTTRDWGLLFILSVVCTVYAFSASVELMKRITAYVVNLTINLEPVYGIILAVIIYGENEEMSAGFYYGTLIILGAVLSYPVIRRSQRKALEKRRNLA
ncbi:DMT family transporter [uncultured Roseivirga sp.]|uniref:DMT family transporter n=1 Tax=uncultured Roseivirga sp. TaxID=543088 RepID=UPI0030D8CE62|tara:strand:- start:24043 stop:24957 length:915 start_codon:yes stop_codon:yes gene_type:complete